MISRRNIRVKVMQVLYTLETIDDQSKFNPQQNLQKQLDKTRALFIYLVYFLTEVARYAETDSRNRAARNLPSAEDLNVNIKIAGNDILWKILDNAAYKKWVEMDKPELVVDLELVKKLYQELESSDTYKKYISALSREKADEKAILEYIFNEVMLANEDVINHIEEHFVNWNDDSDVMEALMKTLLQKPGSSMLQDLLGDEKRKFAINLLNTVIQKKEYLQELITPRLKNWDPDRIALLDMILMNMGVSEFLYFETIPPKVTINEYIDIAKEYSTAQSGQFINGILDNILKALTAENKIHKTDFKQKAS
jgi:transcription antitermination protein NusB